MDWIENAYLKLAREEQFRQGVTVAFDGAWLHCLGDNGRVESIPSANVEIVRWDPPAVEASRKPPRRIR